MLGLLKKLFLEESYAVGWRKVDYESPLPVCGAQPCYNLIRSGQTQWWADPFPFEHNDRFFIFVELYKRFRGLGSIACFELDKNGIVVGFNEVLAEPFHLSYPNVFMVNGTIYMIPESEKANQIRLYRAKQFPYDWELDHVLASGRRFVDSSILFDDEGAPNYLFSQDFETKELLVYKFDVSSMEIRPCESNSKLNQERCGGNCLSLNGKSIRVLQDCSRMYGEKILFSRLDDINKIDAGLAQEQPIFELTCTDVLFDKKYSFERLHTFNRSLHYEVIDVLEHRVVLTKPIRKIQEIVLTL